MTRRIFELDGLRFAVDGEDEACARLVGDFLHVGTDSRTEVADIHVEVQKGSPASRSSSGSVVFTQPDFEIRRSDAAWTVEAPSAVARVETNPRPKIALVVDSKELRTPYAEGVAWVAVTVALRYLKRFHLHAALVAAPDGLWLLVGPSGSGKSTMAVVLRAAGLDPIADDAVLVRSDGTVVGIPRPFHLPPPALRLVPDLASTAIPHTRGRFAVRAARAVRSGRVSRIFALRRSREPTRVHGCRPSEALTALLEQSVLVFLDGAPHVTEHLAALASVVDDARSACVDVGPDIVEAPSDFLRTLKNETREPEEEFTRFVP